MSFHLLCLVGVSSGKLIHHGQEQIDADDGGQQTSANDAEIGRGQGGVKCGRVYPDED